MCTFSLFSQKVKVDKKEAQQAYQLINAIRSNPEKYNKQLGISNLHVINRTKLRWNPTLAKVAEYRAIDMANRNYFDHVTPEGIGPNYYIEKAGYSLNNDWLKNLAANNFESIGANHPDAVSGVKALLIGSKETQYAHRKHLLGMDSWNGSLYDVGIGFVRSDNGSKYKTYLVVIIAKHDW